MTPEERKSAAQDILRRTVAIAAELSAIETLKIQLRRVAAAQGSFTERVAGLGSVEVKAARDGAFKGHMPVLKPELFLALDEAERQTLLTSGVVVNAEQWSKPFAGSVTVRPDA